MDKRSTTIAPIKIDDHLRRASAPIGGPNEQERAESFRHLLGIYREQSRQCRLAFQQADSEAENYEEAIAGAKTEVDPHLDMFFRRVSLRIWESENPVATLKDLMGNRKRGPRFKHADRDFEIAVSVERLRQNASLEKAVAEIAELVGRSEDRVVSIYKRFDRKELRAEVAFIAERSEGGC